MVLDDWLANTKSEETMHHIVSEARATTAVCPDFIVNSRWKELKKTWYYFVMSVVLEVRTVYMYQTC